MKRVLFVVMLLSLPGLLHSLDFYGFELSSGVQALANAAPESGPMPIVFSAGAGTQLRGFFPGDQFYIRPHVSFFGSWYGLSEEGRTVPVETEYLNAVWVHTLALDANIGVKLPVSPEFETGFEFTPRIALRLPLWASGNAGEDLLPIISWFYEGGRFMTPGLSTFATWKTSQTFHATLRAGACYPIANLWMADSYSWYDNLNIHLTINFRFLPEAE